MYVSDAAISLLFSFRSALGAKPFAFRFRGEIDTAKMEPLDRALGVVAPDHLSVRYLVAQTIRGFVWIDRHVQNIWIGKRGEVGEMRRTRKAKLFLHVI